MKEYFVIPKNLNLANLTVEVNEDDTIKRMYIKSDRFRYEDGVFTIYDGVTLTRHEIRTAIYIIHKLYVTAGPKEILYEEDLYHIGDTLTVLREIVNK